MSRLAVLVFCAASVAAARHAEAEVRIVAFGARDAVAVVDEETVVRCVIRNAGDEPVDDIEVRSGFEADPDVFVIGRLGPGEERELLSPVTPGRVGFAPLRGSVADSEDELAEARAVLPVLARDTRVDHEIRSGSAVLRFVHMAAGHGVAEIVGLSDDGETRLGVLPSLAGLQFGDDPCPLPIYAILDPTEDGGLSGLWATARCEVAITIRPEGDGRFSIQCVLTAHEEAGLHALVCPEVHIGSGPGDGYRAEPPADGVIGLASEETGWSVTLTRRTEAEAVLSSPNALGGMGDHLMALRPPAGPPLTLSPGDSVELRCSLRIAAL